MARPETPSQIDVLVQQKAWRAPEVCRGRSVDQQRMHEDDVACRRGIFQHLQRDAVDRLNALVEPLDAGSGLAGGAEVPQVRVHGMSRPIGVFFHVPHGLSNAMLLPAVTAFSADAAGDRYADCARAMGVAAAGDPTPVAITKLVDALYRRNRELQVPSPKQYGLSEHKYFEAIPVMTAQALASGSPQNNPRVPTADEIAQLYREVWA